MKVGLNHVAFLVSNIESALEAVSFPNDLLGKIEEFPSEGTRELYIGKDNQMGRLLLMEAIGDGPYKSALEKRGPGLHHIALDVENVDTYVGQLTGSGWLMHPASLKFYNHNRQVYLSRPATPVLMEIQERKEIMNGNHFIERVVVPFKELRLLESLACSKLAIGDRVQIFGQNNEEIKLHGI
ncbi:MAG: VOC family protein [Bdellovibrionales bacterium]|nr:VOC family protein [Bdellovibrionales bacterium]